MYAATTPLGIVDRDAGAPDRLTCYLQVPLRCFKLGELALATTLCSGASAEKLAASATD